MFAAYHNFCWRTRKPGKSGLPRPTAAMIVKVPDHLWGVEAFPSWSLKSPNTVGRVLSIRRPDCYTRP